MLCLYPRPNGESCGQCANCLINKSLQWKFRLKMECMSSDIAFWLTLQYDDEHLPLYEEYGDVEPCVSKRHCQLYFKSIRRFIDFHKLPISFRYFLKSEYGPQTHRPHYHVLILFKLKETVSFDDKMKLRSFLYDFLKSSWQYGHVEEKLMHSGVIGYLSKYVFKDGLGFEPKVPCFALISKGIGISYLSKVDKDKVRAGDYKTSDGYLPRYYRDKILKPLPESLKFTSIYFDRRALQRRVLEQVENKFNNYALSFPSFEAFLQEQELLRQSKKRLIDKKQKRKYG